MKKIKNIVLSYLINHYHDKNFIEKIVPDNWVDNKNYNLFHYSAFHQSINLFKIALKNQAVINDYDIEGKAPIHRLIEYGFVENKIKSSFSILNFKKKESWISCYQLLKKKYKKYYDKFLSKDNIVEQEKDYIFKRKYYHFAINQELLSLFLAHGSDVNLWLYHNETKLMDTNNVSMMGSPIELLMVLFFKHIIKMKSTTENDIENFHKIYNILHKSGANINIVSQKRVLVEDIIQDAMQESTTRIVSQYFLRYIKTDNDIIGIMPLLEDDTLDFFIQNDEGNTFLHHLFSIFTKHYKTLSYDKILLILNKIYFHPNFKIEVLSIKNYLKLTPLGFLQKEAVIYQSEINKIILMDKLKKELSIKKETTKVYKI